MYEEIYISKVKKLSGTSYNEVYPQAISIYKQIASKTKRRPYIRSKYFNNEKVFLDYFWQHLREKNMNDRTRRLQQYACALDLIKNSKYKPVANTRPNIKREKLFRFEGLNASNQRFFVQIKEDLKRKEKYLISIFPKE